MSDLFGNPIASKTGARPSKSQSMVEDHGPGPKGETCIKCKCLISKGPTDAYESYSPIAHFFCFHKRAAQDHNEQACKLFEKAKNIH